mgnify:CR=1 FL=1
MLVFHLFMFIRATAFSLPILTGYGHHRRVVDGLQWGKKYQRAIGVALLRAAPARGARADRRADPAPQRRLAAIGSERSTPADAVIISAIDPVFLEQRVARHSARRVVPSSREVEYTRALFRPPMERCEGSADIDRRNPAPHIIHLVATEQIDDASSRSQARPAHLS